MRKKRQKNVEIWGETALAALLNLKNNQGARLGYFLEFKFISKSL